MCLDMFLQILRTLEGLSTEVTLVGFQGHMYSDMRSDMIALDGGSSATAPLAGQVEVICALATYVTFTDVFLVK